MDMGNLTGKQAAKFIRSHKGKIYIDVNINFGDDYIRIPAVKADLAQTLDSLGDLDGVEIFVDINGDYVCGQAYR